jgi:hypothetical protein
MAGHLNSVNLLGQVVDVPRAAFDGCAVRIAVARLRDLDGYPEPGVIYVDILAIGRQVDRCAQLTVGSRIGVTGRLEAGTTGVRRTGGVAPLRILIEQIEILDP